MKHNSLASMLGVTERIDASELVEDALTLNKINYKKEHITIIRNFALLKKIMIDRVKLLQILTNLIKNSIDAIILKNNNEIKKITINIQEKDAEHFIIQIIDTGIGISPENMAKIFSQGFTTKQFGHGFGLHASALFAHEMGGDLSAESDGINKGASFTLVLPYQSASE